MPDLNSIWRGLAGIAVYRDGSRGLFQVGRRAIRVSTTALSTVPHDHDLCPLRIRACGEHGHLCRRHLCIGAASSKRYLTTGTAGSVDRFFDDVADRLYRRSPRIFLERSAHQSLPHTNGTPETVSSPLPSHSCCDAFSLT